MVEAVSYSDDEINWSRFVDEILAFDEDRFWRYNNPEGKRLDQAFLEMKHAGGKLLDVGCSVAKWREVVEKAGYEYYGLEPLKKALLIAVAQRRPLVRAVGQTLPFIDECFNAVIAITVLQHQNIDTGNLMIAEFRRILKGDGILLVHDLNYMPQSYPILEGFKFVAMKYLLFKYQKLALKAG